MPPAAVIALFGPTGVGKTATAIALADRLRARGERPLAISADALQVYDGLGVLTGAATAAEQTRLEHRLVGFLPVSETFSAGRFAQLAHAEIDAALRDGRRPIVVGGTGLYLRAALTELDLRPPPDPRVRARFTRRLQAEGPERLHAELTELAPGTAATIAPTDGRRITRALELHQMGELRDRAGESQLWTGRPRVPTLLAGLVMDREALYARIDARVDAIVAAGAREEVRAAVARGASATAQGALGFRQLLDDDVEGMRRRTRQYARRQLTWMRKLADVAVIDVTDRAPDAVAGEMVERWTAAA